MPPRIPISSAFRRGPACSIKTPTTAPLSTTAAPKALHDLRKTTSSILNIDGNSNSSNSSGGSGGGGSTEMVGRIYQRLQSPRPRRADGSDSGNPFGGFGISGGFGMGTGNNSGSGGSGGSGSSSSGRQNVEDDLRNSIRHDDYMRQLPRWWRYGDAYAPRDLSSSEMGKWRKNKGPKMDVVDLLGLRPLDMYRNFSVMAEFTTSHGRIQRSLNTGLRPVNQRKMAKAIRRSIGLGLHPSVHHHPELLARVNSRMLARDTSAPTMRGGWS